MTNEQEKLRMMARIAELEAMLKPRPKAKKKARISKKTPNNKINFTFQFN